MFLLKIGLVTPVDQQIKLVSSNNNSNNKKKKLKEKESAI